MHVPRHQIIKSGLALQFERMLAETLGDIEDLSGIYQIITKQIMETNGNEQQITENIRK